MDSLDSPIFNSSNTISDTADRVVNELLLTEENPFNNNDNDFSLSDDIVTKYNNTISNTKNVKEDEIEFEFPIDENISPRLPLFDRTLLLELNHSPTCEIEPAQTQAPAPTYEIEPAPAQVPASTCEIEPTQTQAPAPTYEIEPASAQVPASTCEIEPAPVLASTWEIEPAPVPAQAPVRFSLRKFLLEARDSGSCSSSDADELDGITPETYCVWKPNESHVKKQGKHKKSNSVSIGHSSKRWNVKDLLKRSYSDDSYSSTSTGNVSPVIVFSPPVSMKPKAKSDTGDVSKKMMTKNPAYKGKIGNIRVPAYYPYRQDQIGVLGNVNNGSSKNLYRY